MLGWNTEKPCALVNAGNHSRHQGSRAAAHRPIVTRPTRRLHERAAWRGRGGSHLQRRLTLCSCSVAAGLKGRSTQTLSRSENASEPVTWRLQPSTYECDTEVLFNRRGWGLTRDGEALRSYARGGASGRECPPASRSFMKSGLFATRLSLRRRCERLVRDDLRTSGKAGPVRRRSRHTASWALEVQLAGLELPSYV